MVICTKASEPWSTRFNRKPLAAFSAAFLVGYSSRVPITLFRGARRPPSLVSRHRNTQIFLPLEETSRLTPPLWIRVLCIIFSFRLQDTDVLDVRLNLPWISSRCPIRKSRISNAGGGPPQLGRGAGGGGCEGA